MWVPDAFGNRAGMNIAEIYMPAVMAMVCGLAAGEFGHSPSKRGIERVGKLSYSLGLKIRATLQGIQ